MDVAHWQPDAKQTPQLSPLPWWTQQVDAHAWTYTQSWFMHNVVQKCSFGSSRDSADVTRHGLCTNYVRDSCEWRGPCQPRHCVPSKRGRQAESIPQHHKARSVQNSSWVCARNGLVVRQQHLWTKMDTCLTLRAPLLCPSWRLNFPLIYLFTGEEIFVSWWPLCLKHIPCSPHWFCIQPGTTSSFLHKIFPIFIMWK